MKRNVYKNPRSSVQGEVVHTQKYSVYRENLERQSPVQGEVIQERRSPVQEEES